MDPQSSQQINADSDGWQWVDDQVCGESADLDKPSSEPDTDDDAEAVVGHAVAAIKARISRWSSETSESAIDDPFWLQHFWDIVEALDPDLDPEMNFARTNFARPLSVLSGCSGLCAEAWALQARVLVLAFLFSALTVVVALSVNGHSIVMLIYCCFLDA
eukprot:Skav236145  [mRNA]  locus=scaffold2146:41889:42368:+ [translate_table: standard]